MQSASFGLYWSFKIPWEKPGVLCIAESVQPYSTVLLFSGPRSLHPCTDQAPGYCNHNDNINGRHRLRMRRYQHVGRVPYYRSIRASVPATLLLASHQ